jgi:fibronectin type 3 domain-containing protein
LNWNLSPFHKLRHARVRQPIRKTRLALEELESRLTPSGGLDFSGGFANAGSLLTYNGSSAILGSRLELTNGGQDEAASTWSTSRQDISKFNTQFTFQLSNAKADGFTFAIEGVGATALGQSGGGLGYGSALSGQSGGIPNSMAIKFDLYNNQGEGYNSTGLYLNGAAPTNIGSIDIGYTGLDLHSGDVLTATMTYDGTSLVVNLADATTNKSGTFTYTVDIPSLVGGTTAFVGFTGGTGGLTATQDILTWTYTPTSVQPPAAPGSLTASAVSGTQINLAWTDNSDNETGFKIERKTGANGTYSQIALVDANVTSFSDTGLSNGTQYFYRVRATNSGGDSAYSNEANATTPTVPAAPTNAQTTLVTQTEVDLSWIDNATNETSYQVWRATAGGSLSLIATLGANSTSYQDLGLTPNTAEDYHIVAVNSAGSSAYADVSATTLAVPAPTGLQATAGNATVALNWTAVAGATSYNVYRATTSGGEGSTALATGLTSASYTDNAVTNGTTYYYEVTAVESGTESLKSSEVSATPQVPAPGIPTNVGISAGDKIVNLTWSAVSGATSYDIYRATTKGGEGTTPYLTGVTTASYSDSGVVDGTTYYYEVSAVNGGGQSAVSSEVSATPQVPAPGAPTNLAATASDAQVSLTWSAVSGATSYDIYRSTTKGGEGTTPYLTGVTISSYTNSGLTDGTTYYYEVSAVNAGGQSPVSSEVSATPQVPAPGAPTNLAATAGDTQVSLTWSAVTGATSYDIYRSTTKGGEGSTPYLTGVTTNSYTNTGLTDGTTYYYEVSAVNAGGQSGVSNEASATPQVPAPSAPTNLVAAAGNAQITLTWTAAAGATKYDLFRSTTAGGEGSTPYKMGLTTTSFTDTGLVNGTTYYYKVVAINAGGQSPLSNEVSAKPKATSLFSAHINFSSSETEIPTGYFNDNGLTFGSHANGLSYGWNQDNTAAARDRNDADSPDELHDSLIHMQKLTDPNASWKIAVPNGVYTIHLVAGDPDFTDSYYKINVNGVLAINGKPDHHQHWFDDTITLTVTNGFIEISNAQGARNNKIDGIDIVQVSGLKPLSSKITDLDYSKGFAGATGLSFNGSAVILGSSLGLTDGRHGEAGSVFTSGAVSLAKFSTQFSFQIANPHADGFTFTLQNVGPAALGPNGGGLGYGPDHTRGNAGIDHSVAVKFDLYDNQGEGKNSTGLYVDGEAPTKGGINLDHTGIDLHSGHVFKVAMNYDGTTLCVKITDAVTGASATQSYTVDIVKTLGSSLGYVGFTAGTGGETATQKILSWKYHGVS